MTKEMIEIGSINCSNLAEERWYIWVPYLFSKTENNQVRRESSIQYLSQIIYMSIQGGSTNPTSNGKSENNINKFTPLNNNNPPSLFPIILLLQPRLPLSSLQHSTNNPILFFLRRGILALRRCR